MMQEGDVGAADLSAGDAAVGDKVDAGVGLARRVAPVDARRQHLPAAQVHLHAAVVHQHSHLRHHETHTCSALHCSQHARFRQPHVIFKSA